MVEVERLPLDAAVPAVAVDGDVSDTGVPN
jgi:hypothetical protein